MNRLIIPGEQDPVLFPHETQVAEEVLGVVSTELNDVDSLEFNALVAIVAQFSRVNPETGDRQLISPSRIAAIPAITARHCRLVEAARGQLTVDQVKEQWEQRMPENSGDRHPDLLFDIAQFNFGTDEPLDDIVRGLTRAERRRQELIAQYRGEMRHRFAQYRYEQPLDEEAVEARVDALIDSWR